PLEAGPLRHVDTEKITVALEVLQLGPNDSLDFRRGGARRGDAGLNELGVLLHLRFDQRDVDLLFALEELVDGPDGELGRLGDVRHAGLEVPVLGNRRSADAKM